MSYAIVSVADDSRLTAVGDPIDDLTDAIRKALDLADAFERDFDVHSEVPRAVRVVSGGDVVVQIRVMAGGLNPRSRR